MQHQVGKPGTASERGAAIEVAVKRHGASLAQLRTVVGSTRQRKHPEAPGQPRNGAQCDVSAANHQKSFHRSIISRPMPFTITTEPGEQRFSADDNQSVLDAALDAGLLLPYGCRDGACGACKAHILSGEIEQGLVSDTALTEAERAEGMALLCKAMPRSDLHVNVRTLGRAGEYPVKKLPCRVMSLERAASDVMVLHVKLPASEPFRFRAGQYIDFLVEGGKRRSFSIANAPGITDHLELHIRRIDGGAFTGRVFETMKEREILRFEGPLGTFFLNYESDAPVMLVAGGTGFAPIKSLVEDLIERGTRRPVRLYWGARTREGLYMDALARSWQQLLPDFDYVPVLSDTVPTDDWTGRRGLVHEAVMEDHPELSHWEVYACGAPAMIDAARRDFMARCALPSSSFFADAFTFANDTST